jgi:hypothetical protein
MSRLWRLRYGRPSVIHTDIAGSCGGLAVAEASILAEPAPRLYERVAADLIRRNKVCGVCAVSASSGLAGATAARRSRWDGMLTRRWRTCGGAAASPRATPNSTIAVVVPNLYAERHRARPWHGRGLGGGVGDDGVVELIARPRSRGIELGGLSIVGMGPQ